MTKLFIGGLPADLDETELKDIFNEFGTVISVNIVRDKRTKASRRFGFVDLDSRDAAMKAIELLHTGSIDDQEISVKFAVENLEKPGKEKARKHSKLVLKSKPVNIPAEPVRRKRPRIVRS